MSATWNDYLDYGFKESNVFVLSTARRAAYMWIYDRGTRAVNVGIELFEHQGQSAISAEAQFNTRGDGPTFNVELLHAESPKQVIDFFRDVYRKMECSTYD
jgi:hypothetical protein